MADSDDDKIKLVRDSYLHPAIEGALAKRKYPLAAITIAQFRTVYSTCFVPSYPDREEAVSSYRHFSEEVLKNYLASRNLDEDGNPKAS